MAIYDIGVHRDESSGKDFNYIVMEYIPGESLGDYLSSKNPELTDLLKIAEKIASGLATAHKQGIVHRDIKTDNIIINENGDPKILDFGLAKPVASVFSGDKDDHGGADTVSQELNSGG